MIATLLDIARTRVSINWKIRLSVERRASSETPQSIDGSDRQIALVTFSMRPIIDLSGQCFGELTVIDRGPNDDRFTAWNCSCNCGRRDCRQKVLVRGQNLKTGGTKSCGGERSDDGRDPVKNRRNNRTYRDRHRNQLKGSEAARNAKRIDKRRAWNLQRNFDMTVAQWELLFAAQGSCCAACRTTTPGGRGRGWATDHCHETGAVRGILCPRCNTALGWLGDTLPKVVTYAELLVAYLKRVNARALAQLT